MRINDTYTNISKYCVEFDQSWINITRTRKNDHDEATNMATQVIAKP